MSTTKLAIRYAIRLQSAITHSITSDSNIEIIDKIARIYLEEPGERKLFFMGVGKNSYLSQKLAATCQSLNIQATYLDAVHFMHGDAGFVRKNDIVIAFSKSGKTSELLHTLRYIKNTEQFSQVTVVAVYATNDTTAKLEISNLSDYQLVMYDLYEADCNCTVPSVSALVMQFLGDLIAFSIARHQQLTIEQFGITHPGGLIGQTINK
jgi:arabinose-5-phosphate isomerase